MTKNSERAAPYKPATYASIQTPNGSSAVSACSTAVSYLDRSTLFRRINTLFYFILYQESTCFHNQVKRKPTSKPRGPKKEEKYICVGAAKAGRPRMRYPAFRYVPMTFLLFGLLQCLLSDVAPATLQIPSALQHSHRRPKYPAEYSGLSPRSDVVVWWCY